MWLTAADLDRRLPPQWQAALVIGDEPLLVEESADRLRTVAKADGYDERKVLETGAGFSWDELLAEGSALSLFSQKQLIELRLPEAKAGNEGSKALQSFLSNQSEDMRLLVIATTSNAPPKDAAWMVRMAEAGVGVRCRKLRSDQTPAWLAKRAKSLGLSFDQDALVWLAQQVEGNLLAARQELEKLPLLGEKNKDWTLEALRAVVTDHAHYSSWDLPDTLLRGDLASGMRMLQRLREEGQPPVLVLSSVVRDIRSLHQASQRASQLGPDRACAAVGIWRNRQPQFVAALQRLRPASIRYLHKLAVALDHTAKSAPEARFWEDLVNLAVRLAGPQAQSAV
ncbi:MAG: DNA polymerase III subunit delta [Oceanococcus sp.]